MRIYSFQGLHYAFEREGVGELAAPPYDQISDSLRDRLQAVSSHHLTHLTRPRPGEDLDPYQRAAGLHSRWLKEGVVQRDSTPALYPYVIEFPSAMRRLGICALVRTEDADSAAIRPHEHTLEKPLADRLELLRATQVDLEPALLVSADGGDLDALIGEDIEGQKPLMAHADPEGYRHLLYRIADPARIEAYRGVLDRDDGAIADGHHRYEVARRYAAETGAVSGTAAASKLAVITSLESPALTIDPIHRGLRETPDLSTLGGAVRERTRWRPQGGEEGSGRAFAAAVAAAPQPALGIRVRGEAPEIWTLEATATGEGLSLGARDLPVALLHGSIFPRIGLLPDNSTDGTVLYRFDPEEPWAMIEAGEAAAGFWLPPMTPAAFAAAIAQGDMLPPKSTRFLPKVVSGLVWSDHESRLG